MNRAHKPHHTKKTRPGAKPMLRVATHYGSGHGTIKQIITHLGGTAIDVLTTKTAYTVPMDRLLLQGGNDIDPFWYGEDRKGTHHVDAVRDEIEYILVRRALAERIPVLGICRGHQMLAAAAGGSLFQHVGYGHLAEDHTLTNVHPCLTPYLPTRMVNSLHHQAVKTTPPGFRVAARADDGIIEAIYRPGYLGVQFHPEIMVCEDRRWLKLFQFFMDGLNMPQRPERVITPRQGADYAWEYDYTYTAPKATTSQTAKATTPTTQPTTSKPAALPAPDPSRAMPGSPLTASVPKATTTNKPTTNKTAQSTYTGFTSHRSYGRDDGWRRSQWPDDDAADDDDTRAFNRWLASRESPAHGKTYTCTNGDTYMYDEQLRQWRLSGEPFPVDTYTPIDEDHAMPDLDPYDATKQPKTLGALDRTTTTH